MCPGWNVFVSAFKKNLKAEVTMCISKNALLKEKMQGESNSRKDVGCDNVL